MKYYNKDYTIEKEQVEEEIVEEDVFGVRKNRKKKKTVQHRVNRKGFRNYMSRGTFNGA